MNGGAARGPAEQSDGQPQRSELGDLGARRPGHLKSRGNLFELQDLGLMSRRLCPIKKQLYPRELYGQVHLLSPKLGFRWFKDIFCLKLWQ